MRRKVLFVLLDAFRGDYINGIDTPFLHEKMQEGIYSSKMKSVSGFTQRTAIYCGVKGTDSGMFTMFTFDEEDSPYKFLKESKYFKRVLFGLLCGKIFLNKMPEIIKRRILPFYNYKKHCFRIWCSEEVKKYANNAPLANIPFNLLPLIGVSEDQKPIYMPKAFDYESIFDVFVREGIDYKYFMYPLVNVEDDSVLEAFIKHKDSDAQIFLGQFSDSDCSIHHCGPASYERRKITGEIDRKLREIDNVYGKDVTWIIIGDHGMMDVAEEVNVFEAIRPLEKECKVKNGRDYVLFLDSTMARFLWRTQKGKIFIDKLKSVELLNDKGFFVDEEIAKKFSIPFKDRKYGDVIWASNPGVLLFPDYFHDEHTHNKGMHGFISDHDDLKGFFLAFGPGIIPQTYGEVDLIDVCPSICSALNISFPVNNKGVNLINFRV